MQNLRAALVVPTLLLSFCAFAEGSTREETRDVSDFHGVEVGGGIKAQVTIGPKSVRVSGDDKQVSLLRTEVEDGKLVVNMDKKSWGENISSKGVRVVISTPKLTHVGASGGAEVEAEATSAESFSVDSSGGSELTVRKLDTKRLEVEVSGGGEVTLKGRADSAEVEASGGAEVHAKELSLKSLEVEGSGGVSVDANPSESIKAELSGGSSVHADSAPARRKVSASGGSQVVFGKE
ncbi:head GIN domain-containing protein [Hyalangium versicolor]|uniref:head GIN domain-containing protein n=1 Tax=Hyalangium versicolor TaxID=2861190 RepID=UPI001CCDEB0C|nr:head GIN domain-containing protein [Hyalangium versicolor]